MKRVLLVIIALTVSLVVYRSPFIQKWLSDGKNFVMEKADSLGGEENITYSQRMLEVLDGEMGSFTDQEQSYLKKITQSQATYSKFNRDYCDNGEYHPILKGQKLETVCTKLALATP